MDNITISPCCNPEMSLEEALSAYAGLGFRKFEAFTTWVKSAFDFEADPQHYIDRLTAHGMRLASLHLPPITDEVDATLARAVRAARFAAAVGADTVIFKGKTRELLIRTGRAMLDAVEGLGLSVVLTNHAGTAISTLADYRDVIDGIADPRMKTCLEVGHFHSVGVSWRQGCELLGETIALVHIKDQVGRQSVPFGTGQVDLPGLFAHMRSVGYGGDFVVEMEVADRENTLTHLAEAVKYLQAHCLQGRDQ